MVQLLTRIILLSLMVFLSGCVYVPPVWDVWDEIYHLDNIKPGVTTKDQVLAELGKPDTRYELTVVSRFVYTGHKGKGAFVFLPGAGDLLEIAPSDWTVTIDFDENDVVSAVHTSEDEPATREDLETTSRQLWQSLCLAAHNGDPEAQHGIGRIYEDGKNPVGKDLVLAYAWYRLALKSGYEERAGSTYRQTDAGWECCFPDRSRAETIAEALSDAEIAKAKHLVANWQPNPAECEAIPAQANK